MDEDIDELRRRLDAVAREHLVAAGFNESSPDPRLAWIAFKRFATAPLPQTNTITIGYEACQASDRDHPGESSTSLTSRGEPSTLTQRCAS